tara:strand:- start:3115 stop:3552 length:438 start_codon:yes stop_codon:yes gene_type:complete
MSKESFDENFTKGLLTINKASDKDDQKFGIDAWFDNDIPVAIRKRPTTDISDYDGRIITIRIAKERFRGYIKFEYDKLLSGDFKSILYIFRLKRHIILIPIRTIIEHLKETPLENLNIAPNYSGQADLIGLHPSELAHCLIIPID